MLRLREDVATETKAAPETAAGLSDAHRRVLEVESAIDRDVWQERSVRTTTGGRDLPKGFSQRQRRRGGGVVFIAHRPNGQTSYSFRPDGVDPESPGHRYEQPCKAYGGPGNILDVHPGVRHLIEDKSVPVIFAEGIKKADAITSAARRAGVEVLVVAIFGVWNWLSDGEPIPDMFDIPVEGRKVTICFDSDMLRNPDVQDAAGRLAEHLIGRGAEIWITYLHDHPDGSKTGVDDFLATGGTINELRLLTRRYEPGDFVRVRLSRNERLLRELADLERVYSNMPAATVGECSNRATFRELNRRAERSGNVTDGGIVVRASVRSIATDTRLGRQAQSNSLRRLEEDGYIKRLEEPKHKIEEQGAAYLLRTDRALSGQRERESTTERKSRTKAQGENPHRNADSCIGVHLTRSPEDVPELRHPKVVHTYARRDGRRVVVDSDYVYRLGKQRWEIVAYLVEHNGSASESELLARFGSERTRLRDFRRRRVEPLLGWRYSKDKETGAERKLETGPPIVTCEHGTVSLLPEWRAALKEHRKQTDEDGDTKRQRDRYQRQSAAYRNRDRKPADKQTSPLLGKAAVRPVVADRRREDKQRWIEEQRTKVGMTASVFLSDEMDGGYGARFKDVVERWRNLHSGSTDALRQAVHHGPFMFRVAGGDLYIEPEPRAREPEPEGRLPRKSEHPVFGLIYNHGPECDCGLCADEKSF